MTQSHQIICGCKICIQAGTYQDSLDHWCKRRLIYIKNRENPLTRGSVEQLNAENIVSRYSGFLLPDVETIHPRAKYAAFAIMCDFPDKDIKFPKWPCVLNCYSEYPGFFLMRKLIVRRM